MCDRRKIHVFLGAPPPPRSPASVPEAELEEEHRPPAGWRHLELTWRDGQLRPADGLGNQTAGGTEGEADRPGVSLQSRHNLTNTEADWTEEGKREQEAEKESLKGDLCTEKVFLSSESDAGRDDRCSASVHEYLDHCFPAAQPDHQNPEPPPAAPPLSSQTHYLTTWTLSQALFLRDSIHSASSTEKTPPKHTQTPPSTSSSTPELFSPATPSPAPSAELFSHPCPTPRVEEGGVVLQATTDGVLYSQVSTPDADSPTKSPSSKKARISVKSPDRDATTRLQSPTTLLAQCDKPGMRYSVLVAVVHPCHLKEVKVKSGPSAGTLVPLASVVVTDQSGVEMKVVLWRLAAFWALTVGPGDILLITALQVNEDRWRGETVLQSTFSSKLLNLGQLTASSSPPVSQQVNAHSLTSLCGFLRERRPLLVSLPRRSPQNLNRLPYVTLRSLRVNTLVHALLRVTHTHISSEWRAEAESRSRSAVQLNAVLTVEQPDGQQGVVFLWGAAVDWLPRFSKDKGAVWDFHTLLVREGLTSDLPELHSTPWSSVQATDPTDRRVRDFHRTRHHQKGNSSTLELDLDTLLSQKYSGDVELRVQVITFRFQDTPPSQNAPQPILNSSTSLEGILMALSGDITYTGCGRCSAELDTDTNGIYSPCYPCLPHTAVRRYYRPGMLTVSGRGCRQVCVQVPPVPLQTILDAPPDKLHRSSGGVEDGGGHHGVPLVFGKSCCGALSCPLVRRFKYFDPVSDQTVTLRCFCLCSSWTEWGAHTFTLWYPDGGPSYLSQLFQVHTSLLLCSSGLHLPPAAIFSFTLRSRCSPLSSSLPTPEDHLLLLSAPGSEVKHVQVAAERIQTLLCLPRKTFIITIRSNFLCDENSVPISQDFTLLDLQFPS